MERPMQYRNATYALIHGLDEVLQCGQRLTVRGSEVIELRNRITIIKNPLERCIITPQRQNNIFATLAETVWVMAGRNDLAYLSYYLPRASDFSDDGKTWRGGYGPRLRNWHGVDQFLKIKDLLAADHNTRRAVMVLFDPAADTEDGKDIPCNNWLDWLIRDNKLNLSLALRSNDAVWGFSGINSFEWSVLQEMLAYWLGVGIGDVTFFAASFHIYARHEQRAAEMVKLFNGKTWYEAGAKSPSFATSWEVLPTMLADWFAIEASLHTDPAQADSAIEAFPDPLFRQFLAMLQLYNGLRLGWSDKQVAAYLSRMPENDLTAAAYEYCSRNRPAIVRQTTGHDRVKAWLSTWEQPQKATTLRRTAKSKRKGS